MVMSAIVQIMNGYECNSIQIMNGYECNSTNIPWVEILNVPFNEAKEQVQSFNEWNIFYYTTPNDILDIWLDDCWSHAIK